VLVRGLQRPEGEIPLAPKSVRLGEAVIGHVRYARLGRVEGIEAQHIAGDPTRPQFIYYLGVPLVMAACALGLYHGRTLTRSLPKLLCFMWCFCLVITGKYESPVGVASQGSAV